MIKTCRTQSIHAFGLWLIVWTFLVSKRSFSIIVQTSSLSSWLTLWNQMIFILNINITFILLAIFQDEHRTEQLKFTWLSRHHLEKSCSNVSQIWSSGFWGTFICSSLNRRCIALYVLIIKWRIKSSLREIIERYKVKNYIYFISC